jgi:hypothetical protein
MSTAMRIMRKSHIASRIAHPSGDSSSKQLPRKPQVKL